MVGPLKSYSLYPNDLVVHAIFFSFFLVFILPLTLYHNLSAGFIRLILIFVYSQLHFVFQTPAWWRKPHTEKFKVQHLINQEGPFTTLFSVELSTLTALFSTILTYLIVWCISNQLIFSIHKWVVANSTVQKCKLTI